MTNKPAKTFRDGAIGLSVWERQGKKGVFHDFTLSRSYKNGGNGNAYASTFREDNAEVIARLVVEAAAWIRENGNRIRVASESLRQAVTDHAQPQTRAEES